MTINRRHFLQSGAAVPIAAAMVSATATHSAAATPKLGGQVPAMHRFTIGDVEVTALLDGHIDLQSQIINGFNPGEATRLLAESFLEMKNDSTPIPVNGYLVNDGTQLTLIDTGTAQLLGPTLGNLNAALMATGVSPQDIDTVLLTHMHPDHSGGLVDADGQAVFPNAELAVAQSEWDFWYDDGILVGVPEQSRGFFKMARDTTGPYSDRLRLFEGESEVLPGITALPLPGHTPGHTGYTLSSGDASLLFWGDVVHSAALQFAHPEWTVAFDMDPTLTVQTRKQMLDRAFADKMLVTGAHLDFPGLGHVLRDGDQFRYQAAPWQYAL